MVSINYWAVLVAAAANFIIGFMFHGPLFGKMWMKLANVTPTGNEKFKDMIPQMVWNFLANVLFAYVLAVVYAFSVLSLTMAAGVCSGMAAGFLLWLVVVAASSMEVIWMKRSFKLWVFELVSSLVAILAMGAIIGAW